MDNWIKRFREAKPISEKNPVLIPGDPERAMEIERKSNGVPLLESVVLDLVQLGVKLKVPFPS
jgi:LDH2 family malate/lactate/ureidoglycolate dehydrogenase